MDTLSVIAVAIAIVAVAAAVLNFVLTMQRDAKREARERAVAKAAYEYLAKHGISSRTIGNVLADGSMALMIETAPHKKLRFSAVIEPSIRAYVQKMSGIDPQWVFWRFPIEENPGKGSKPAPAPSKAMPPAIEPKVAPAAAESKAADQSSASSDGLDDYLQHHRSYHIEEVSWNDFSNTVSSGDLPEPTPTDGGAKS